MNRYYYNEYQTRNIRIAHRNPCNITSSTGGACLLERFDITHITTYYYLPADIIIIAHGPWYIDGITNVVHVIILLDEPHNIILRPLAQDVRCRVSAGKLS